MTSEAGSERQHRLRERLQKLAQKLDKVVELS